MELEQSAQVSHDYVVVVFGRRTEGGAGERRDNC